MSQVQLVDYQDTWPAQFRSVADALHSVFADPRTVIEHIGSTSVPGLCSKPVLDILLGVTSLAEVEAVLPALASAGFVYRREYEQDIPDRRYFIRPPSKHPRIHLHGVVLGGLLWTQHLRFRDRLRQDSDLRESYAALKKDLAVRYAADKAAYTEAKAPFIEHVLASGFMHPTRTLSSAA